MTTESYPICGGLLRGKPKGAFTYMNTSIFNGQRITGEDIRPALNVVSPRLKPAIVND